MKRYINSVKRAIRRNQTGQAIILLAFGFILLLGFVGIVTDLSILYIRYASLRRAVDSAAVAAAGQFSRTETDQINKERTQFAARQFLEFHGINADNIVVDTCSSVRTYASAADTAGGQTPDERRAATYNQAVDPVTKAPAGLTIVDFENDWGLYDEYPDFIDQYIADQRDAIASDPSLDTPAKKQEQYDLLDVREDEMRYRAKLHDDVCGAEADGTLSGRKLVRVQASIGVPAPLLSTVTGFLTDADDEERISDIVLTAAAVSETASLDVVIVMDVSESMLFDTRYDDYDHLLLGDDPNTKIVRYLPPRLDLAWDWYESQFVADPDFISDNFPDDGGCMFIVGYPCEFSEMFLSEYELG